MKVNESEGNNKENYEEKKMGDNEGEEGKEEEI